jgi:hypothetical protein
MNIYIIGMDSGAPYKVGVAKDSYRRLIAMQTAHPDKLRLYATAEAETFNEAVALERRVHKLLSEHSRRGEWFDATFEVICSAFENCGLRPKTFQKGDMDHELAILPPGMTPDEFQAWIDHMRVTRGWLQHDCACALGVQPRQISRWKQDGTWAYVNLACAAIAADIDVWTRNFPKEST